MKRARVPRAAAIALLGCLALAVVADDPVVSTVVSGQRWPWSRLVNIDYQLTCEATQRVDVTITAYSGTTPLILPLASLSGDLYNVAPGMRRIVWDPGKTAYTNELFTRFSVEPVPTSVPLYMIVDLTKTVSASNQVTYIYPGDVQLETYGRWTNVWFGVTNSTYKTDKLVLRRVPAGSYMMGANAGNKPVTLTQGCYAGVFELTAAQWYRIMGTDASTADTPKGMSYNLIRGATNSVPPVNWYTTGTDVSPTSFIGRLRAQTGMGDFDLPTEAQWQYLCRAGTQTYYSDGVLTSSADTNVLNAIGWWAKNSSGGQIKSVGLLAPNAWGLFDMHGNVWEICLDWSASLTALAATNPPGPVSGTARVACGGAASLAENGVTCGSRGSCDPATPNSTIGFRIVRTLQ